jgi:hypothetical protein
MTNSRPSFAGVRLMFETLSAAGKPSPRTELFLSIDGGGTAT